MIIPGLSRRVRVASTKSNQTNQTDEEKELDLSPGELAMIFGTPEKQRANQAMENEVLQQLSEVLAPKKQGGLNLEV